MGNVNASSEDLRAMKSSYSTTHLNKKLTFNSNGNKSNENINTMSKRKKSASTLSLTNQLLNNKYDISDKCLRTLFNGTP